MDKEWYDKTKDMTEQDQWNELYKQQIEKRPDGKSVWLPKNDINKYSGLLIKNLESIFDDLGIETFVDVGCSDAIWQATMDWSKVKYLGLDIVKEIAEENKKKYPYMNFEHKNLIEDECPRADMIFVRNVFLHTTLDGIKKIINNIKKSGSMYFMASTLTRIKKNEETACIWAVRRNLEIEPFNLKEPLTMVPEILPSELKKKSLNNYMGLWRVSELPYFDVE